jgi:hypothetical protein
MFNQKTVGASTSSATVGSRRFDRLSGRKIV